MDSNDKKMTPPRWLKPDGSPVSCTEKVMVLNENYEELSKAIKDALEDALVLGCSEEQVRASFHALIDAVQTDIKEHQHQP
jgi:DNA-binding transcriptional regulator YhcF (GntR family)